MGITVAGPTVTRADLDPDIRVPVGDSLSAYDRQVQVFGIQVQKRLSSLRIGIVGLGGTGSMVAEQLAHLGIQRFVLVDPDVIELSNLNRVVGASGGDIARPKVDVAAELIRRVQPSASAEKIIDSVNKNSVLMRLRELDAIFCCTDSHGSRHLLNELAYRFLVPCFDCGVVIAASDGQVTHVSGRAQMLAPGLACLTCSQLLDPEQVRRDLMADYERALDPYILGNSVPQPAVISLNGSIVSLAVTMFLGAFGGLPIAARHQRLNAIQGTVRVIDSTPIEGCISCSAAGGLAVGSSWPLPGRPD
jgi:molybdopterin/thiamine biosynthesis adenylyltransferase